jgi:hypothetical protein
MMERTHSSAFCAPYMEKTPPKLHPTRLTFLAGDVVQVTNLLRQCIGMFAAKTHVAAQTPGVHVITLGLQIQLEGDQ